MVRRVLKDNKVPGTSVGAKVAEALARAAGSAAGFLERTRLGCLRGQVLVCTRGACIGGLSQKEKEKIQALSG